jgi:Domain of unknown function (DUF4436)
MKIIKKYLLVLVPVLAVAGMFWLYSQDSGNRGDLLTLGSDRGDRLEVQAAIQTVDPIKGEMSVRLDFTAHGNSLLNQDGTLLQEINILINSTTKNEVVFKRGQRLSAVEITTSLYDGQYTNYPFDRHRADLEVSAWINGTADDRLEYLPLQLELASTVYGFRLQANQDPESQADKGYLAVQLGIARAATTTVWALFVMFLLWAMALAVVAVTHSFATGQRKLEFGAFTWMGSMLFAFVGFRSAAPGVPPIGALIDVLAFFWAELIVAVCLVTTVLVYLRRSPTT